MSEGRTPGFTCKRICTHCKKRFEIPNIINSWGWNIGERLFCSYTCMRAWEKSDREKRLERYAKQGEG